MGLVLEKVFSSDYMIGVEEVTSSKRVREITLFELMSECNCFGTDSKYFKPRIKKLSVKWSYNYYHEIEICEIYDFDTGEIHWEHNDLPENRMWGGNDEKLVSSLLMWGDLEDEEVYWNE
jgi:hypothetical protein|tara:strand:+ start:376 stop:735 length:360 start_codon:yes stop_codon:yes gene_type:complete